MNNLTKKEKLKLVLELCADHSITAYELGKNTTLTDGGAHKILTGESKNPQESSLNNILIYIEKKLVGSKLNEPRLDYQTKSLDTFTVEQIVKYISDNKEIFYNNLTYQLFIENETNKSVIKRISEVKAKLEAQFQELIKK